MNFLFTRSAARRAAIETAQDLISLAAIIGAVKIISIFGAA